MKKEVVVIFIAGYIVFCALLNLFGMGDLIKNKLNEEINSEKKHISSYEGFDAVKTFIQMKTEIKPDDKSSPLAVSKEELGRHTWVLLHSIAATYPLEPTENDKVALYNIISGL